MQADTRIPASSAYLRATSLLIATASLTTAKQSQSSIEFLYLDLVYAYRIHGGCFTLSIPEVSQYRPCVSLSRCLALAGSVVQSWAGDLELSSWCTEPLQIPLRLIGYAEVDVVFGSAARKSICKPGKEKAQPTTPALEPRLHSTITCVGNYTCYLL
jgi:hypothetical protein